jgi:transposase, IS30 family
MGKPKRRRSDRKLRAPLRSPGRPGVARREDRQRFWAAIAEGVASDRAGVLAGVSGVVGVRWFREGGGMRSVSRAPLSGRYLSFAEREEIALLKAGRCGVREIARRVGRSPSTISRELRGNAATRSGGFEYRATTAQWHADRRAQRPKPAKLASNPWLREYVQQRLSGVIVAPGGAPVSGPATAPWKGRNKPHRQDRRWVSGWSPQQISERLKLEFPDDPGMRISHEAIYQALYVQSRGALKRELVACLRTGRALRVPRARARQRPGGHVTSAVMISQRPAEADDRAVPGHWEGDLIIGSGRSAIGTLVERSTRFTVLLHLPRAEGWGIQAPVKNGPALGGYGAEAMRAAIAAQMTTMPEQLRRSLTWDRGGELAQHAQLKIQTGIAVYFADPHSPWQRAATRTPTGCCASTSPKAPTCRAGAPKRSKPSPAR